MIPIVIPAYEPDERLINLLDKLIELKVTPIIIVDDGSGEKYQNIFNRSEKMIKSSGGVVLHNKVNKGKGRALKEAFKYIINEIPNAIGCITSDSDGQHTPDSIIKCMKALKDNPSSLILGYRDFTTNNIPKKSKFGNIVTRNICKYLCGLCIKDTQTGLRGIPIKFMKELLDVNGERFEFETQMLIATKDKYSIIEVQIETIYDSTKNHQTHFKPIIDSVRIYKIFGKMFLEYILASISSSILDLLLFTLITRLLSQYKYYVAIATIISRVFSGIYNYLINYKIVFKSKINYIQSGTRYLALAIIQMSLSAILVTIFKNVFKNIDETLIKIPIDLLLFFISYYIQQEYVYKRK